MTPIRAALLLIASLIVGILCVPAAEKAAPLSLNLRHRGKDGKATVKPVTWDPKKTAVFICDMWDDHWCKSAAKRCGELAKKADPVIEALRKKGVTVIHCPSDTMAFYADAPQRKAMQAVPRTAPPASKVLPDPPLPIDDKDGGCDDETPSKSYRAWKRQHAAIEIGKDDFISDNGLEVYSILKGRGIDTLLILGVHTNMCVCNRSFAIKQMTRWGVKCVLVRDLTDSMYNPKKRPFVSHDEGTELVIKHIEKHWCPTVLSSELGR